MIKREYPNQPIVGVGAVIIDDNGKVLLVKRAQPPGKDLWAIPGGIVKLGETLRNAVKREIKEETGLEIKVGDILKIFEVIDKDENNKIRYHYIIIDFEARVIGGKLHPSSDALNAKWFSSVELKKIKMTRTTRKLLNKLMEEGKIK